MEGPQIRDREEGHRVLYFDLLRIVSVFAMMMIHVASGQMFNAPINGGRWMSFVVYDSLARFCVPVFIMISGALFLNPEKQTSIRRLYTKNLARLVTAFLFWSGLYAVVLNLAEYRTINYEIVMEMLEDLVIGPSIFWFLFMIAGLYIMVPLLKPMCAKKETTEYFLVVAFCFVSVLIAFGWIDGISSLLSQIQKKMYLSVVTGYVGYFIAGHYLHSYPPSQKVRKVIYLLGIVGVILTAAATWKDSQIAGRLVEKYFTYLAPNVWLPSMAVFLLAQEWVPKIKFSPRALDWIGRLSRYSFGMYLCHEFFNVLFEEYLGFTTLLFNGWFSVPVITSVVFILSFLVISIVDRIPVLRKYVM